MNVTVITCHIHRAYISANHITYLIYSVKLPSRPAAGVGIHPTQYFYIYTSIVWHYFTYPLYMLVRCWFRMFYEAVQPRVELRNQHLTNLVAVTIAC